MLDFQTTIIRLLLATLLSGLVGFEREIHGRAAGLRTHILVGLGSCLIMLVSLHMHEMYKGLRVADPGRIAAQVVSGIGFLGAGTILRFRASIVGLTTAASIWAIAGIGLAVGIGLYYQAVITTLIIIVVLFLLSRIERNIARKMSIRILRIDACGDIEQIRGIRKVLNEYPAEIHDFDIKSIDKEKNKFCIEVNLRLPERYQEQIISDVLKLNGTEQAKWLE
jgi:putative Mg2+ transporter-C (MgtC) family protein